MTSAPGASQTAAGRAELGRIQRDSRGLLVAAVVFSIFVNLLMLTGPLYMLQVYDRVLGSRSEETLVALSILVIFLFLAMGLLDHARARIMARIGARLQAGLDRRVFEAALTRASILPGDPLAMSAQRDLHAIQQFWSSPVASALMDMPWTPVFLAAIFIFHPTLGWLAIAGGTVLICLALVNQRVGKAPILRANSANIMAEHMAERLKSEAELLRALGMTDAAFFRWPGAPPPLGVPAPPFSRGPDARPEALSPSMASSDMAGAFNSTTRTLRLFLQSAILGLGAWLVLQGQMTAGAMTAGSI